MESPVDDQNSNKDVSDVGLDTWSSFSEYNLGPLAGANAEAPEYLTNWAYNVQENNPGRFIIPKVVSQSRKRCARKEHVLNTSEFFPHWFNDLPEIHERVSGHQDANVHSELIV